MSTLSTHILQTYVCQDSHSYAETIDLLLELRPREILLHDGSRKKPLARKVQQLSRTPEMESRYYAPVFVARGYFDQDRGADLLRKLSMNSLDQDLFDSYIFLASAHCLLKYMGSTFSVRFPPRCLKVSFGYGFGKRLVIDRHSVRDLELVSNARTGSQRESLFGYLNRTKTDVGAKALKANLLAPLTDKTTIDGRLDLIELLISRGGPETIEALQTTLANLTSLDRMLAGIAVIENKEDLNMAKKMIHTVVLLKTFLQLAPTLVMELTHLLPEAPDNDTDGEGIEVEDSEPPRAEALVRAIIAALSPPMFAEMVAFVLEYISESTIHDRSAKTRRLQECFAVSAGLCGLLDVARKTFLQSVEDIYALASTYAKDHGLPELRVLYSTSRGYYLSLPSSLADLPPVFIQCSLVKKTLQCTTQELTSLSRAADESANQCILLTCAVLRDNVLGKVREPVESLFKAVEAISLLDMIVGFADLVMSDQSGPWTRPEITAARQGESACGDPSPEAHEKTRSGCGSGALAIKQGRHPVVCKYVPTFVPNDAFAGRFGNMVVVSGVNGSGKTVFVKSLALIVVLAQIGCFVPAEAVSIPIRDRIFTSLSTADDMESNLSTFMSEMRRAAYIIDNLSPDSLVILDELGRGTSTMDGSALSYSIAEALLSSPALSFFVTHYRLLLLSGPGGQGLSSLYGNVRHVHLEASLAQDMRQLAFKHRVTEGPSSITCGYGIALAAHVGFPEDVLMDAERVKALLEAQEAEKEEEVKETKATEVCEQPWKYEILRRLMFVKECIGEEGSERKTLQEVREMLQDVRATAVIKGQGRGNRGEDTGMEVEVYPQSLIKEEEEKDEW